jgi:hypothetical protein
MIRSPICYESIPGLRAARPILTRKRNQIAEIRITISERADGYALECGEVRQA